MIVCHCRRIRERTVLHSIREGARTVGEVMWACEAGADCAGCHPTIAALLESEEVAEAPLSLAGAARQSA